MSGHRRWFIVSVVPDPNLLDNTANPVHRVHVLDARDKTHAKELAQRISPGADIRAIIRIDTKMREMFRLMLDLVEDRVRASEKIVALKYPHSTKEAAEQAREGGRNG